MSNQKTTQGLSISAIRQVFFLFFVLLFGVTGAVFAAPVIVPTVQGATNDLPCIGTRNGSSLNCTAREFTVGTSFSAASGTPPFCVAGQNFEFLVDLRLSGSNADRRDMAFYTGQVGNDPQVNDSSKQCSVATFPILPLPYFNDDGDTCGDYKTGGDSIITINKLKVVCAGNAAGALALQYTLAYHLPSDNNVCSGPTDVAIPVTSKCQGGTAAIDGTVAVNVGAYVDVTKQTNPDGDTQAFSYTATGPADSKVTAQTAGVGTASTADDVYSPALLSSATNSVTVPISDNQTVRFFITALSTAQTLTITEAATTGWEPTAAISCAAVRGSPTLTTNNATRTMTAALTTTNSAAACTVTNTKRPTLALTKVSQGGTGSFTFTGNNGWSSQTISTATHNVGVSGAAQTLTTSNTITTLSETLPTGYTMIGVTCTGMGAGGMVTPNLSAATFTLDAAATAPGSNISCTVTNAKIPTVKVQKTTTDGVGGPFSFTQTNLASAPANITTTVAATATPSSPTAINVTAIGTAVTLTETPATGFVLTTASCTDANSSVTGNTGVIGTLSGNILTIPASNVQAGADFTCSFTNLKTTTLQLVKAWGANSSTNDSATVGATTGGSANTTAFTTAGGTAANSGAAVTITVGNTITFPAETGTNIGNYNTVLSCLAGGGATANSLSGTNGQSSNTLLIGAADAGKALVCTYTNTRKSTTFRLAKAWGANSTAGNVANLAVTSGLINNTAAFTSTASTATNGVAVTVFAGETATLPAETMSTGILANYNTVISCDAGTLTGTNGQSTGNTIAITAASTATNPITCTYTNTPIPAITITGRVFNDNSGTTGSAAAAYNGIQNTGEVGIQGSQVALTNCSSTVVATTTTNAGGDYSFKIQPAQLPTPNFCVVETNVSGYTSVSGTSGYSRASDTITISNTGATTYTNHNFGDAQLNLILIEDGQQTIIAGAAADYPHRLSAQSVLSIDSLAVTSSQQPANSADQIWQNLVYRDSNCNGKVDSGENVLSTTLPLSMLPNQDICLVQRVYAPSNASSGAQHLGQLQASFSVALNTPAQTITRQSNQRKDTTLITGAGLSLQKSVRTVASCPSTGADTASFTTQNQAQNGNFQEYEITYRNNSTKNLVDVKLKDSVPTGTVFQSMECTVTPSMISSCTPSNSSATLAWQTVGVLPPNREGKVRFCVQIP